MKKLKEDITYSFKETINKSIFITSIKKISTKNELNNFIETNKDNKASHNVFAYKYRENGQLYEAFKEDGEPHGTSGKVLLNVVNIKEIEDIIVLVKRYYGGVKLGTGNLARAYKNGFLQLLKNEIQLENLDYINKLLFKFHIKDIKYINSILSPIDVTIISKKYIEDYCLMEISSKKDLSFLGKISSKLIVVSK